MKNTKRLRKEYLILLLPVGVILIHVYSRFPHTVEKYCSTGFNRAAIQTLSAFTALVPFSVAEMGVVLLVFLLIWYIGRIVGILLKRTRITKMGAGRWLVNLFVIVSPIYFCFVLLWGLNYYRLPFAYTAHLQVRPASTKVLASVCADLISRADRLRTQVDESQSGVMRLSEGKNHALAQAAQGYQGAAKIYPELGGEYGKPKQLIFSEVMSYLGLTGVYCPFTGEANVDVAIPNCEIPFTICHEMAHQRGYAREDEANYISYITCNLNPSPDFRYSGTLLAVSEAMATLKEYDVKRYRQACARYSPGLKRDLAYSNAYWEKHRGVTWRITSYVNDFYLKSNGQNAGVYSYDRMVDLLIAEYRSGRRHYYGG